MHQSVSRIPPKNLVKYRALAKQTPISNLFFGKMIKKFGLNQLGTYLKTRKKNPAITFPYMPNVIPNDAYLYDFHVHSLYSDGTGSYEDILMEVSRKKHINGIAITDHPFRRESTRFIRYVDEKAIKRSFKFNSLVQDFRRQGKLPENFISFPGSCEFLTKLDDNNHANIEIIALGVSENFVEKNGGIRRITRGYALELIEKIHDDNGIAIVPHPFYSTRAHELLKLNKLSIYTRPDAYEGLNYSIGFLYDTAYYEFFEKLHYKSQLKIISILFGFFNWMATIISQENDFGKHFTYPLAKTISSIGSSDAHLVSMVGAACTLLREPINSLEDLRKVLSKKKTLPIYNPIWSQKTNKNRVYEEIWEGYDTIIEKSISRIKKQPLHKLILYKILINIFSHFFL